MRKLRYTGIWGAYCLAEFKIKKDPDWIHQALSYHQKGLEARQLVFGKAPDSGEGCGFIGTSYHCLATDYFALGEYKKSLENHRQAIAYRELGDVKYIRKAESYNRCIGTLIRLFSTENDKRYIKEALALSAKLLMLDHDNPKGQLNHLLANRREFNDTIKNCGKIIACIKENPAAADSDDMAVLRKAAEQIDALCGEISVNSDLRSEIDR